MNGLVMVNLLQNPPIDPMSSGRRRLATFYMRVLAGSLPGPPPASTLLAPMNESMQEVLLLHVTGDDRPGLTARLTAILGRHGISILDLNQTVIHRTLLMGMMVRIPPEVESTGVLKDLLFGAHEMGLKMRMTP